MNAPYPAYRETSIDWIGALPAHWVTDRLKWSVESCKNGIWGAEPDGGLSDTIVVRVADFDRTRLAVSLDNPTYRAMSDHDRTERGLNKGDLLLEKSGGGEGQPVGVVVLYDDQRTAVCSNFVARIVVADGMNPRFWCYLHAAAYAARVNVRSIKQTSGIQNLDQSSYFNEIVPFPPLPEQIAIATFLDRETAKIDALVDEQEQLIDLLKEKRQAIISHAVTKGVTPGARMKNSGIEWLGEVPEHWAVTKLGRYVSILSGYAFPSSGFSLDEQDTRLLRGINVGVGETKWDQVVYWPREGDDLFERFELRAGQIVVGMDRPWINEGVRVARIIEADLPCLLLQRVAALTVSEEVSEDFVYHLLSSALFVSYFTPDMTGVSVPHLSPEQISNFIVAVPPLSEQQLIAAHISDELKQLAALLKEAEAAIVLLQERRAALISAAVTGKIDVRSLVEEREAA